MANSRIREVLRAHGTAPDLRPHKERAVQNLNQITLLFGADPHDYGFTMGVAGSRQPAQPENRIAGSFDILAVVQPSLNRGWVAIGNNDAVFSPKAVEEFGCREQYMFVKRVRFAQP